MHGELLKVRSEKNERLVCDWRDDLLLGQKATDGGQLRSHVVWFGELVPLMEKAIDEVLTADMMLVIGTSLQVYPAASLIAYLDYGKPVFVIDPNSVPVSNNPYLKVIRKKATEGVKYLDI